MYTVYKKKPGKEKNDENFTKAKASQIQRSMRYVRKVSFQTKIAQHFCENGCRWSEPMRISGRKANGGC